MTDDWLHRNFFQQDNEPRAPNAYADKTGCPKGHLYTEANTYVNPSGHWECRECRRERNRSPQRRAWKRERERQLKAQRESE